MPNVDWTQPQDLVTPAGTVLFNVPDEGANSNYGYLIQPGSYKIVPSMRVTADNLSQQSGSFLHPRFKSGLVATLVVQYLVTNGVDFQDYEPACDSDLRIMHETLTAALDSMLEDQGTQRLIWDAPGALSRRMLESILTLGWTEPTVQPDGTIEVTFQVETALPYAIDFTQQSDTINAASGTITNPGTSSKFLPVVQVQGPASTFQLKNNSVLDDQGNPLEINYDGSRPGAIPVPGGHYAELDFFKGSIFLDGNSTDLTAGLDPETSDFWPLVRGANNIDTDCDATFLWNPAWA